MNIKIIIIPLFLLHTLFIGACSMSNPNKAEQKRSIGVAEMAADGTITLYLRAEEKVIEGSDSQPAVGDAMFTYKKDNPDYKKILEHLGGMNPGESKDVKPWPDGG